MAGAGETRRGTPPACPSHVPRYLLSSEGWGAIAWKIKDVVTQGGVVWREPGAPSVATTLDTGSRRGTGTREDSEEEGAVRISRDPRF